jgi:hypothetical protein
MVSKSSKAVVSPVPHFIEVYNSFNVTDTEFHMAVNFIAAYKCTGYI